MIIVSAQKHSKHGEAIPAALNLDQEEDIHIVSREDAEVYDEAIIILVSFMLKAVENGAATL